ncbi:MAG TPA: metallophosphoesterase, partial [Planctomycetota bacterium]|nr:metallophosphoesterase [Planctomycetota bacterium]
MGDVQGCLVELEALLRATDYDPTADELFFVGDLIRKGPESAGVLRLVRDLKATCVLGNHDFDVLNGGKCPADLAQAEDREALFDLMA